MLTAGLNNLPYSVWWEDQENYHSSILACLCGTGLTMTPFLGDRVIVFLSSRGSCPGFSSKVYCWNSRTNVILASCNAK